MSDRNSKTWGLSRREFLKKSAGPHNVRKHRGVRTDRYKLIHYYEEPQEFELYDLPEDPGELRNLYGDSQYAQLARELMNRITELRRETGD